MFELKNNLINISNFARHYNNDIDSWLMDNRYFIDKLIEEKTNVLTYSGSDWFACRELALKYAQHLSVELEITLLKFVSKAIEPVEVPKGSLFSVKITSYLNLTIYGIIFVDTFF